MSVGPDGLCGGFALMGGCVCCRLALVALLALGLAGVAAGLDFGRGVGGAGGGKLAELWIRLHLWMVWLCGLLFLLVTCLLALVVWLCWVECVVLVVCVAVRLLLVVLVSALVICLVLLLW